MASPVQDWITEQIAKGFDPGECVLWPFARQGDGYGSAWDVMQRRVRLAHHVIWGRWYGEDFPADLEARHQCAHGRDGCVNPLHIIPGTHAENMRDMVEDGRRTDRQWVSKITAEDVLEICRRCALGEHHDAIGLDFGIDKRTVHGIWSGRSWRHVDAPRIADVQRHCAECGTAIPLTARASQRFCSQRCGMRVANRRWRERQKAAQT